MSKTSPVAFVLAGGASLGAVQVGMLRALYERGVAPDIVVGTSAGALNGALSLHDPRLSRQPTHLPASGVASGAARMNALTGLLGFLGSRDHLVPDSGLRRLIASHVEHELIEEMPLPLHVVAVDVIAGEELRMSSGPVVDAVLASASIPAALPPVSSEGRVLMDGGAANNTPISHAVDLGAQEIYVLPTGHACALEQPPRGALTMALNALSILTHQRLIQDIEKHAHDANLIVLPPPCPLDIPPTDLAHAEILIQRGYVDACEFLDSGGSDRPPIRMRLHLRSPPASTTLPSRVRA